MSLLDVGEDVLYQQFFTLSQGEQTKVMLAALFLKENEFLLIDEPTNHLDGCVDHVLAINRANIE